MPQIAYSTFGLNKIVQWETGGMPYYNKYLQTPTWPGGSSGVTLACGIDIGYYSKSEIADMFDFLTGAEIKELQSAAGITGARARLQIGPKMSKIHIPYEEAIKIFQKYTVPKYTKMMLSIYPNAPLLNPDTAAMLLSLVYNRGNSLNGSTRQDMKDIVTITETIEPSDYEDIAEQFIEMERLWVGKGLQGLIDRREEEAAIIKNSVNKVYPEDSLYRVNY